MFQGKSFDNFLRLSFFMFMSLTFLSLGQSIYDRITGEVEQIILKPALTFMFFAFFSKYQYAVQYWAKRLELINEGERQRRLRLEKEKLIVK
jgi:hypothetical protein